MIAFLFPGQGAQQVGMGRALVDAFPEARSTFEEADAAFSANAAGMESAHPASLSALCFEGPEEQLRLTEYTQPAMLTVSVAAARVLASLGIQPDYVAGHSLGEYSANVVAGTLAFADAVAIVRRRGRYMQEAVPVGQGAMAAILGLDIASVQRACDEAAQGEVVSPANINSAEQVVIAGAAAAVERAGVLAKASGAKRVMPLPVSAPFHCALMKPAEERLAPELRALTAHDPRVPVVANVDAQLKRVGGDAIDALVRQISSPVRWEETVERLASEGVTTYVEVGVGRVLSGLVKKAHREATVLACGSPEDVSAVELALRGTT
ncbi:MAG: ACP S-malonyltransferase [Acidobacteria bacterium]|nr:ACP S-malonyltransferase [Acidobacteriota bacterium]